ncbi:MAG: hypothetical protein ACOCTQ_02775 [Planctomycetota bacterium]
MHKLIVCLFVLAVTALPVRAVSYGEAAVAAEAAPEGVEVSRELAREVVRLPRAASELLYVPMGGAEIVLSPLPGIGLKDGLKHVGKGALAPFKVAMVALELPFKVLEKGGSLVGLTGSGNEN